MIHMGHPVPNYRLPLLTQGTLRIVDTRYFQGQWIALCFTGHLTVEQASFLDSQVGAVREEDTSLLAVSWDRDLLLSSFMGRLGHLQLPILVDTLRRLHRAYHLSVAAVRAHAQTFVIDPQGALRFHLMHELTYRGLRAVRNVVSAKRLLIGGSACLVRA